MFRERFLISFSKEGAEENAISDKNVDKVGRVKNILDQLRNLKENVSTGAIDDNSTPYRNELINALSTTTEDKVKEVKHTGAGVEIIFLNGQTAMVEGDSYTAMYWQEISANTLNLIKKPNFSKADLGRAVISKDSTIMGMINQVRQDHVKNAVAREVLETRSGTAKEFEDAVKQGFEELKQIYGNDEAFWKAYDERKIYDALRKQIETKISPEKFASLTPGAVKVRLELPHRKKDKPGNPKYIYLVNTRHGDNVGVEVLESDKQVLNEQYGERDITKGVPGEKLDGDTEKMRTDAAKELKQEIEKSWDHFKNLEKHRSDLYWDCTTKSKREAISQKFAEVLKINIKNNPKLQEGMRFLTGGESELKGINLTLPGTDHIIDVSYVVSGVDTPGLRFTWSGELVSDELYFYPVMAIGALSAVKSAYTPDADTLAKATNSLEKLTPEKQRATFSARQSLQDLKANLDITMDTEKAQPFNSKMPDPNDALAGVNSIDNWEANIALSEGQVNPDSWDPIARRGEMRKDWIALGIPAQHGNPYFDSVFNQLRKCTDSEFLKDKAADVRSWYANPNGNLEKIRAAGDAAFCTAWRTYEGIKTQMKAKAMFVHDKIDSTRSEDREPVLDSAVNFAKQSYRDFGRAVKERDYGAIAAYGIAAYAIYRGLKWLWGKSDGGWGKGLKIALATIGIGYSAAYIGKRNGHPGLYNLLTLKSATDSTSKDNPMLKPLLKIVPQAGRSPAEDGLNENIFMRASKIKMSRLQELYNSSGGSKFIDPKEFRDVFKEFDGVTGAKLEKDRDTNYLNTGRQLYLIAQYINTAYQKTLWADPKKEKYYGKSLSEVLGEYPHKYSDVGLFIGAFNTAVA